VEASFRYAERSFNYRLEYDKAAAAGKHPRQRAQKKSPTFCAGPFRQAEREEFLVGHDLVRKPVPTFRDHA
jgi:hypothetical protein